MFAANSDAAAVRGPRRGRRGDGRSQAVGTETRDLFRRPIGVSELSAFDGALFDPPRAGAEAQARQLAASAVPLVVAVSCNATTFARDARILIDGGFRFGVGRAD